jgi:hypothetical protein
MAGQTGDEDMDRRKAVDSTQRHIRSSAYVSQEGSLIPVHPGCDRGKSHVS